MKRSGAFAGMSDADLVEAARGAEPGAYGELFERWYDRCYDVALNIGRNRDVAADVAQDAFLACWEQLPQLRDPAAFGGWILRATRNRALNRLERDRTRSHDPIDSEEPMAIPDPGPGPDAEAERDDRQRLIWTAAAALGERDTSLLDLHLRHGLEPSEIAEELSITPNNAYQLLFRLRGQLRETIGAVLLWREGRPTCDDLAGLVKGRDGFDADAASTIKRHRRKCRGCSAEILRQTQPELLFSSVPVAVAAAAFKDQARAALAHAGVPMAMPTGAPTGAPTGPEVPPSSPADAAGAQISTGSGASPLRTITRHRIPVRVAAGIAAGIVALGVLGSQLMPGGSRMLPGQDGDTPRPWASAVALPLPSSSGSAATGSSGAPSTTAPASPTGQASGKRTGTKTPGGATAGPGRVARKTSTPAVGASGRGGHPEESSGRSGRTVTSSRGASATTPGERGRPSAPGRDPVRGPVDLPDVRDRLRCPGQSSPQSVRVYFTMSGYLVVVARCGDRSRWWLVAPCFARDAPHGAAVSREPLTPDVCLYSSDREPVPTAAGPGPGTGTDGRGKKPPARRPPPHDCDRSGRGRPVPVRR